MKALFLTKEYPPHIYGGAGVHVDHLSRALAGKAGVEVEVRSFSEARESPGITTYPPGEGVPLPEQAPAEYRAVLEGLGRDLQMAAAPTEANVLHCHTWYTSFAGLLMKKLYRLPLVLTVHSLEPERPWKREAMGNSYDVSTWVEKIGLEAADAVIAVASRSIENIRRHADVDPGRIHLVPNGIDVRQYKPTEDPAVLKRYGIDPDRPYVLFVGRMTPQKGLDHFLDAAQKLPEGLQVVICAGKADSEAEKQRVAGRISRLREVRTGVVWIDEMVSRETVCVLYSSACVFCCPSIYEPFGLINLEAMACGTPVVASRVGGIVDLIDHDRTGYLVDMDPSAEPGRYGPADPDRFAAEMADYIRVLADNPQKAFEMGEVARKTVEGTYDWRRIARKTREVYEAALAASG